MERIVSATEARIHFGELIRQVVEQQQAVVVERAGKPFVVLLSVEHYQHLLTNHPEQSTWQERVRHAHGLVLKQPGREALPPIEETLQNLREERDEQLVGLR